MATIFIPNESSSGEPRVAATPESIRQLIKNGLTATVAPGAGSRSFFSDEEYRQAGATIGEAWDADIVASVAAPSPELAGRLRDGAILIAHLAPHRNRELVELLVKKRMSAMAMELIPRTTRAQSMDALSSQASISGYKAVLVAAAQLPRYFPLLMTAAGTIKPAKVVVMGAGVAGLQALATAKRLGAVVEVSDIRPAVKEQVQSLGGRFIDLPMEESGEGTGGYAKEVSADFLRQQREVLSRHIAAADVVITTAQVPGKKAPVLVTRDMVEGMRPGSIVVDLAVDSGGNCELSNGEGEVNHNGVRILGFRNLATSQPYDASLLYARNVQNLIGDFVKKGEINLDFENEIIRGAMLTHAGEIRHAATAAMFGS
jgi:NAD(P) transhydrogenase subunit alpha